MGSKKKTATCSKCSEEKQCRFTKGMCNACYEASRKKTATCPACGEEKHSKFTNGMCLACYHASLKKTATCTGCDKRKHGSFTNGMCNACYEASRKKTAACLECGEEKHGRFTNGMCFACYQVSLKKTATCMGCDEEKHGTFVGGVCFACYINSRKKTAACTECGEMKHDKFVRGVCNACCQRAPQAREKKNAWERQRAREDESYRLAKRISAGIWFGLSGKKSNTTLKLIGCTHEELLSHFQATMHEGCGENPHVGHILVPAAWARKYAGDEGVILCFQLANLAYQNPDENRQLGDSPWYDCPFITAETVAIARKFLAIAGTNEPELAELAAFVEVYESASVYD